MGEIWRNKGKYERLGKPLQERARWNTISWDFSRGEINLGLLEMPCTSQKTAARTTQLAQRLEKNSTRRRLVRERKKRFSSSSEYGSRKKLSVNGWRIFISYGGISCEKQD